MNVHLNTNKINNNLFHLLQLFLIKRNFISINEEFINPYETNINGERYEFS